MSSISDDHQTRVQLEEQGNSQSTEAIAIQSHEATSVTLLPEVMEGKKVDDQFEAKDQQQEQQQEQQQQQQPKRLIVAEERSSGTVSFAVVSEYLFSGGILVFSLSILMQLVSQILQLEANFWLSSWGKEETHQEMNHSDLSHSRLRYWLNGYAGLQVASVLLFGGSRMIVTTHRTNASIALHTSLLSKVLYFPVSFFDVTPIGRVINRFSQDMATIDEDLPQSIGQLIGYGGGVIGAVGGIVGATKGTFLILFFPLVYLYSRFQSYFASSNTSLARIESISRSPIYADFSQMLSGTSTIRAYAQSNRFFNHIEVLANENTVPGVLQQIAVQWLSIRLDLLGALVMLFLGILSAALDNDNNSNNGNGFVIPAGYFGLGLSYAIAMTSLLKLLVRGLTQVEAQFNSVDRVSYYMNQIPIESSVTKKEDNSNTDTANHLMNQSINNSIWKISLDSNRAQYHAQFSHWPSEGRVEFRNVVMGYRDGEDVLRDVSFYVDSKEKIGIAGRTGCGKSSLMVTLFRIEEIRSGQILIDDVDIATIPLEILRHKLCIIPQEPVLFSDTIRFNIDPFDEFSDAEVWSVLSDVNMKDYVIGLPNKLNEIVAEGGDNFSAGQRQLLCIARAILRHPKILVMDEATASIDHATDSFIQQMIRDKFRECTVLTIAHRLETIIDSSKILVMDAGRVAEFDSPKELLVELETQAENKGTDIEIEVEGDTIASPRRSKSKGVFKGLWERRNNH